MDGAVEGCKTGIRSFYKPEWTFSPCAHTQQQFETHNELKKDI